MNAFPSRIYRVNGHRVLQVHNLVARELFDVAKRCLVAATVLRDQPGGANPVVVLMKHGADAKIESFRFDSENQAYEALMDAHAIGMELSRKNVTAATRIWPSRDSLVRALVKQFPIWESCEKALAAVKSRENQPKDVLTNHNRGIQFMVKAGVVSC